LNFFKKYFDFRIYKTMFWTLFFVAIAVLLFFFLPPAVAYENGPLENLQVVELVVGAGVAYVAGKKAIDKDAGNIWYSGAVTFLICAGRELNWGRVLYPASDHNKFLPLKSLWYGPLVYPLLTIVILATLYMLWRSNLFSYINKTKIPFWNFVLFIVLYFAASYAEHKPMTFGGQHFDGEILEELFECICYWLMIDITRIMGLVKKKT